MQGRQKQNTEYERQVENVKRTWKTFNEHKLL